MHDATGGELRIGLGRSGIALLHSRGWLRRRNQLLDDCAFDDAAAVTVDDLAAALARLLTGSRCQKLPVRLVLGDDLARSWIVTAPRNATRQADCQAAAAARFQVLYGEAPTGWHLAADWHARLPFLASALPQTLAATLFRVCADHQLLLLEVVPQFVAAWNRWRAALKSGHWFGVLQGRTLTLGAVAAGRLCALRSLALPPTADADPAWLRQQVQREALRWMLAPPIGLQLCGALPAGWGAPATADWACSRIDREFHAAGSTADGGALGRTALQLAVTGLR